MHFKVTFLHFILSFFTVSYCFASKAQQFKDDLLSPFKYSQQTLLYGSLLTGSLIITREQTITPIQEYMSEEKPLGHFSNYGDLLGQLIPNIAYSVYQWNYGNPIKGKVRAKYMAKVTLFAGGSTFFLKRIINQRRPKGRDRNSFPSGHTTTAFAFASVISHEHPSYRWYAYALASFVGLSRVNDNAHYFHDVVMGATIGMAFGEALHKSQERIAFIPVKDGAGIFYRQGF